MIFVEKEKIAINKRFPGKKKLFFFFEMCLKMTYEIHRTAPSSGFLRIRCQISWNLEENGFLRFLAILLFF